MEKVTRVSSYTRADGTQVRGYTREYDARVERARETWRSLAPELAIAGTATLTALVVFWQLGVTTITLLFTAGLFAVVTVLELLLGAMRRRRRGGVLRRSVRRTKRVRRRVVRRRVATSRPAAARRR